MTELSFAREVCDAVAQVWRPTSDHKMIVNLPATVEAAMPNVFADQVEWMDRNMGFRDSTYCRCIRITIAARRSRRRWRCSRARIASKAVVRQRRAHRQRRSRHARHEPLHARHRSGPRFLGYRCGAPRRRALQPDSRASACGRSRVHGVFGLASGRDPQGGFRAARAGHRVGSAVSAYRSGRSRPQLRCCDPSSQSGKGCATYLLERGFGFTPPRRVQIKFSHAVQRVADQSGEEKITGDVICSLFKRQYFDAGGTVSRVDAASIAVFGRRVSMIASAVGTASGPGGAGRVGERGVVRNHADDGRRHGGIHSSAAASAMRPRARCRGACESGAPRW